MNCIRRDIKNTDELLEITSNNDLNSLELTKTYKLVNGPKENKYIDAFKNSILGTEIGLKASGFSNILIIGTLVAIGALLIMYALWRV